MNEKQNRRKDTPVTRGETVATSESKLTKSPDNVGRGSGRGGGEGRRDGSGGGQGRGGGGFGGRRR